HPMKGVALYTFSAQNICGTFDHMLDQKGEIGMVVADSRMPSQNSGVSFSVLTRKLSVAGDACPRIVEAPTFGHSENHAGLQVCDLLCSGLLYPIAAHVYCAGYISNIHVQPGYSLLRSRYMPRLGQRQYRYYDTTRAKWVGGITVADHLASRPSS